MSLFDRQGVPQSLLQKQYEKGEDEETGEDRGAEFDDDTHTLFSFSLVYVVAGEWEFEMHGLVQFSTKKWLELSNELERWRKTYVMPMDEIYPVGRYEDWATCQPFFPHAAAVLNSRPDNAEALGRGLLCSSKRHGMQWK